VTWFDRRRSEKPIFERRESLEEVEERKRQLATRLALGLDSKRKLEELPIQPAEAYVVTPHRKRRPGFHNAPAQNPAFVPFNPGFETPRRLQAPHPLSVSAPPYLVGFQLLLSTLWWILTVIDKRARSISFFNNRLIFLQTFSTLQ